jgi:VanZ family protein
MREKFLMLLRRASLWLFLPGAALIIWGELTPHPPDMDAIFGWDKLEHFTAYFGLASMATMVIGWRRLLLWAWLGIVALGGVLEILQGYTGRDPDIHDFIANSIGAVSGLVVGLVFLRLLGGPALVGDKRPR